MSHTHGADADATADTDTDTEDFDYSVVGAASSFHKRGLPDDTDLLYDNDAVAYGAAPAAGTGPSPGGMSAITESLDSTSGEAALQGYRCNEEEQAARERQKNERGTGNYWVNKPNDEEGHVVGGDNRNDNNAVPGDNKINNDDADLEAEVAYLCINPAKLPRLQPPAYNGGGGIGGGDGEWAAGGGGEWAAGAPGHAPGMALGHAPGMALGHAPGMAPGMNCQQAHQPQPKQQDQHQNKQHHHPQQQHNYHDHDQDHHPQHHHHNHRNHNHNHHQLPHHHNHHNHDHNNNHNNHNNQNHNHNHHNSHNYNNYYRPQHHHNQNHHNHHNHHHNHNNNNHHPHNHHHHHQHHNNNNHNIHHNHNHHNCNHHRPQNHHNNHNNHQNHHIYQHHHHHHSHYLQHHHHNNNLNQHHQHSNNQHQHQHNKNRPQLDYAHPQPQQDVHPPNGHDVNPPGYEAGLAPAPGPPPGPAPHPRPPQAAQPPQQQQQHHGCENNYGSIAHNAHNGGGNLAGEYCPPSPNARPVGLRQWRPTNICPRQVLEIFDRFRHAPGSSQQHLAQLGPNSSSSSFSGNPSPGSSSSSIINKTLPHGNRPPRRKAIVIGCEYRSKPVNVHLRGCMNDVALVYDLLTDELEFVEDDIIILTDDFTGLEIFRNLRHDVATRDNILYYLDWLVTYAQPGDRLWFSFSGHGKQIQDWDGDEFDGFDESLVASDMKLVVDDEIVAILKKLPPGACLTGFIDACHSGTAFDLPFVEKDGRWMSKKEMEFEVGRQLLLESRRCGCLQSGQQPGPHFNHPHDRQDRRQHGEEHKTAECSMDRLMKQNTRDRKYEESVESMRKAGLIIQFGGSRDGSVANNAPGGHNGLYYGALTLAFGHAVHLAWKNAPLCPNTLRPKVTYYQILSFIRNRFGEWKLSDRQTPQLSCSRIDLIPNLDATFEI